ncbi:hypothetical protein CHS0354_041183 [Potamilus streckersoni]|uniref:Glycosyltransferase n=1 Tax=Potamilus streckersoni TaxID=2493646 RepID=A0AAE0VUX9_9BIVA|nr:hypothetical protein CHS0354_041183 [Potamilus streckersoni]
MPTRRISLITLFSLFKHLLLIYLSLTVWYLYGIENSCSSSSVHSESNVNQYISRIPGSSCLWSKYQMTMLNMNLFDKIPPEVKFVEMLPSKGQYRIERIIHQTWKIRDIPVNFWSCVESVRDFHKNWEYRFWTDNSARKLVRQKYSYIFPFYSNYNKGMFRVQAFRYMVLHEYGGVYIDMDMKSLLPLDPLLRKYTCILAQEPHEHAILEARSAGIASDSFLACRKGHIFMKTLIENLPSFFPLNMWYNAATGTYYLTHHYRNYVADNSFLEPSHDKWIYLAPPEYFIPGLDPFKFKTFRDKCSKSIRLSKLELWACASLGRNGFRRRPLASSFTEHMWSHTLEKGFNMTNVKDILSIVPWASL